MTLLAEAGCNTRAINNNGVNALMSAAESGVVAAVRLALAAGWCELEARSTNGDTAFLFACFKGHVECMKLLQEAGCNTRATNNYGANALMYAGRSGVAAAVRTALAAGWCELEARTKLGGTAFLVACDMGHVECMQVLQEAGCNTAAKDNCNRTAKGHAEGSDNSVEAIQWLRQRDTANTVATLLQEGQELLASGRLSDAKTVAAKACSLLSLLPGSPELYSACIELRDAIQATLTKDLEEREHRARVAEAELMAMLDSESTATNRSVEQERKAQRKKDKRRKQQQAKREAAARRAEGLTDPVSEQLPAQEPAQEQVPETEPVVEPEPEPDEQQVPLSSAVSAPESPCAESESDGALTSVRTAPDEFCCPITSDCMRDPVMVVATGMTYEREAIAEWLSEHDIDPSTGIKLGENKQLVPNVALRKMIDAWSHGCLLVYSRD
jgi:ankyrin repeat protein